jgi:hypothetical protein
MSHDKLKKRLAQLHQQLGKELPPETDTCAWKLLKRALKEALQADKIIFEYKVQALVILIKFGWRDVFKESLNQHGEFISKEEAGRFEFCLQ